MKNPHKPCGHTDHIGWFSGGERISFEHEGTRVSGDINEILRGDGKREPDLLRVKVNGHLVDVDETNDTIQCEDDE